jgi:hypothetical protein
MNKIEEILNKRIKAVVRPYAKNIKAETLYKGTPEELAEELSNLIQQEREEAVRGVIEYMLDGFEREYPMTYSWWKEKGEQYLSQQENK